MPQDNKDIDYKLRQLENQQLPDLSDMEAHWKQMEAMVQSHVLSKPFLSAPAKWALAVLSAAMIVVIVLIAVNKEDNKPVPDVKETALSTSSIDVNTTKGDNVVVPVKSNVKTKRKKTKPAGITGKTVIKPARNYNTAVSAEITGNTFNNTDTIAKTTALSVNEKQAMLQQFVTSLKKNAVLFKFRNNRDTILTTAEGTVINIPANSFAAKDSVIFEVREFYKYSDMLLNGLTTMADDKQLVSGGMFFMSAKVNGKEVAVNPGSEIRVFVPGVQAKDSMQVFEGVEMNKRTDNFAGGDTLQGNAIADENKINWLLSRMRIDSPVVKMFIRAIDLRDDLIEYSVNAYNNKTKAVFYRARTSVFNKEELREILQKKYGSYYDKIKLRRQWERNIFFQKNDRLDEEYYRTVYNEWGVGDTAELLPSTIRIHKLQPIDTVYRTVNWIFKGYTNSRYPQFSTATLNAVGEKYSIGLTKLGWINCDRFYNYPGKISNFTVSVGDSAVNYTAYLVFDKIKSIMNGMPAGKQILFANVPVGEPVKVIAIGVKDGKLVAAVKNTITSTDILKELTFEDITGSSFKNTVKQLDN